jgi:hypothetical protein
VQQDELHRCWRQRKQESTHVEFLDQPLDDVRLLHLINPGSLQIQICPMHHLYQIERSLEKDLLAVSAKLNLLIFQPKNGFPIDFAFKGEYRHAIGAILWRDVALERNSL